jgi:DNA-binding HxlR family transcriptional regulator
MYKRKKKEDLDCGLFVAMKVFGSKWKPCIIHAIALGARRPSEIHKQFTTTSPRVLDMQLSELLDFGVVIKKIQPGYPLYAEYSLTPFGESILPVLAQMATWGETHKQFVKDRNEAVLEGRDEDISVPTSAIGSVGDMSALDALAICQSR